MRVLLAIDGSGPADRARDLVSGLAWPADTHIRVVAALNIDDPQLRYTLETALDAAVGELDRPWQRADRLLLCGRAASAIVDEATEFRADLIVVGSRGHGPFQSMLLGSVSAEVVDHAPCPVLVVRRPAVRDVLLAEDGSATARRAAELVAAWPMFAGLPVTVLSVAETILPLAAGMAPGLYDEVLESYAESITDARRQAEAVAEATADRLRKDEVMASPATREGDAAHEIVEYARTQETSLIVVGTRGHTGLTRLVLGSVARNVLLHAPCSVLVVRHPVHAWTADEGRAEDPLHLPGDGPKEEGVPASAGSGPWTVGGAH